MKLLNIYQTDETISLINFGVLRKILVFSKKFWCSPRKSWYCLEYQDLTPQAQTL